MFAEGRTIMSSHTMPYHIIEHSNSNRDNLANISGPKVRQGERSGGEYPSPISLSVQKPPLDPLLCWSRSVKGWMENPA